MVSAQAETAERQAPCTADNQVPNFLCRERSSRPACRMRVLATAIGGWHKKDDPSRLCLVACLSRSATKKREPLGRLSRCGGRCCGLAAEHMAILVIVIPAEKVISITLEVKIIL